TLLSVPPSVSQLEGAGRRGEIGALFRQALWMAVLLSVFLFAFLTFIPHALAAMGIAAEIIPGARDFLHGIRWGVPALTLFFCMRYLSEGLHWTLPTMLLSAGGLLVLLPLGYVLT
ncbi:MATE family efflux transporter, partial [Lysobacter sp. 2RAB21]